MRRRSSSAADVDLDGNGLPAVRFNLRGELLERVHRACAEREHRALFREREGDGAADAAADAAARAGDKGFTVSKFHVRVSNIVITSTIG